MGEMARKFYGSNTVPGAKKAPRQVTVRPGVAPRPMPAPAPAPEPLFQGFADAGGSGAEGLYIEAPPADVQWSLQAGMMKATAGLRFALGVARAKVAATPSTTFAIIGSSLLPPLAPWLLSSAASGDVKGSVTAGLNQMESQIVYLEDKKAQVLAGNLEPTRWYKMAEAVEEGIAAIAQELDDSDLVYQVRGTLDDLKSDFDAAAELARKYGKPIAWGIGGTLVLGLLVGGFVLWKLLPGLLDRYLGIKVGQKQLSDGGRRRRVRTINPR